MLESERAERICMYLVLLKLTHSILFELLLSEMAIDIRTKCITPSDAGSLGPTGFGPAMVLFLSEIMLASASMVPLQD